MWPLEHVVVQEAQLPICCKASSKSMANKTRFQDRLAYIQKYSLLDLSSVERRVYVNERHGLFGQGLEYLKIVAKINMPSHILLSYHLPPNVISAANRKS